MEHSFVPVCFNGKTEIDMKEITYMPVDPDVMELLRKEIALKAVRTIYFGEGTELKEANGKVADMISKGGFEYFLKYSNGEEVRIDRIISYNLKPGPAYDEYDEYALQCLTCQAGYDFDD